MKRLTLGNISTEEKRRLCEQARKYVAAVVEEIAPALESNLGWSTKYTIIVE